MDPRKIGSGVAELNSKQNEFQSICVQLDTKAGGKGYDQLAVTAAQMMVDSAVAFELPASRKVRQALLDGLSKLQERGGDSGHKVSAVIRAYRGLKTSV